jgi:superfamily II DNA/RNA helicase
MTFNDFALRPEILQAVAEAGYESPTPIQQQAIPIILTGSDLLGIAQTGTGKTAAFVLPMIERLASGRAKARMPRSLILSPTRELATQTANYFATYGKHLHLTMALLIGGVGMDEQWRLLERGVDVLIATPGRLLDQFERGKVLLGGVTILVIDEADRMLDMGFMPDVERIVGLVSRNRQTLMFSATMPPEIRRLADAFLSNPKEVQATPPATTAAGVEDHITVVPARDKFQALRRLIETQEVDKALIFCNRKREVASLRRQLERAGLNVRDIHGDLEQSQRTQALDAFKRGEIDFLVATDVAARGLDIVSLPCVINYDVPTHADDYVHRIGRTGRAGQEGRAFTLILPEERRYVDAITRLTGKDIPRLELPGVEAAAEEAAPPRRRARTNGEAATARRGAARKGAGGRPDSPPPAESEPVLPAARRRNGARVERASAKPAPAEPDLTRGAPETPRPASPRAARAERPAPSGPARAAGPVVGMGDHVPLFMRRPVPNVELLPKLVDD